MKLNYLFPLQSYQWLSAHQPSGVSSRTLRRWHAQELIKGVRLYDVNNVLSSPTTSAFSAPSSAPPPPPPPPNNQNTSMHESPVPNDRSDTFKSYILPTSSLQILQVALIGRGQTLRPYLNEQV